MPYFTKDKPYNTINEFYLQKYNQKVAKIPLNANLSCPNRDGTKGYGGCIFCSKSKSGDFAGDKSLPIKEQFKQIKAIMDKKWPNLLYIPYFQAGTNTYANIDTLKSIYEEAINAYPEKIVGISIATRSDCITDEIVDYLDELNKRIPVTIELGLQTTNEKTISLINRCSTNEEFILAVKKLRQKNIEIIAHIINGLPYENETDMLNTIDFINCLDIQGIKIHSLLILKDTNLEELYNKNKFHIMSLEEYVNITVKQICNLKPTIIIHRLAADGTKDDLIEPKWSMKKLVVMNEIDKKMRKEHLYQGIFYKK
ncbi:MAG: TIGR01212 family radical SAM protein [Anaeroplasma sp.]